MAKIHLIVSAFVTPEGLSRYRLGRIMSSSADFRFERFLTSVQSMSDFPWASVRFFIKLDKAFEPLKEELLSTLREVFPRAKIDLFRLEWPAQWRDTFDQYPSEDLILLNANDDHAMVPGSSFVLQKLAHELRIRDDVQLGLVSHFPEVSGQLIREHQRRAGQISRALHDRGMPVRSSIGTVLAKSRFIKSWFGVGVFSESERVVRPDNPFGRSVEFDEVIALVPEIEIFRHLDGYSHAGLYRPVPPLRNTLELGKSGAKLTSFDWQSGLWPMPLFAYSGRGVDVFQVDPKGRGLLAEIACVVSRCKLHWGLRIHPFAIAAIRNSPSKVSNFSVVIGSLLFVLTPVGIQNLFDLVLDFPSLLLGLILKRIFSRSRFLERIWYFGTSRTALMSLAKKFRSTNSTAHKWL